MRALLALAVVACGHKAAEPTPGSAAPAIAATGSAADPEVFASQPPQVTLTAAGVDPHAYSYAPKGGQRSATLTFSSGPADMPKDLTMAIAVTLAWTTPVEPAKPYAFRVTESKAIAPKDVKGGEAAVMGGIGAMYSTIAGRVDADAHGRATLARTTSTLPTQPSLLWILHPFVVPLPAEPIGVGATWTTTQPVSLLDAASGTAQRTYKLTAIDGDALTIDVSGNTRWGNGSDAVIEVVAGTIVVKPSDVLAQSGHVTSTQDLGLAKAVVDIVLAP